MVITKPTVDDFSDTTVMRVIRKIVEYIIDTLVPAINEGGGGSSYVLPPATKSTLGGIIVGNNLTVDESGKVNAPAPYTLPVGGTNIGGVKNGGNVTIESDGTMNSEGGSNYQLVTSQNWLNDENNISYENGVYTVKKPFKITYVRLSNATTVEILPCTIQFGAGISQSAYIGCANLNGDSCNIQLDESSKNIIVNVGNVKGGQNTNGEINISTFSYYILYA